MQLGQRIKSSSNLGRYTLCESQQTNIRETRYEHLNRSNAILSMACKHNMVRPAVRSNHQVSTHGNFPNTASDHKHAHYAHKYAMNKYMPPKRSTSFGTAYIACRGIARFLRSFNQRDLKIRVLLQQWADFYDFAIAYLVL